MPPPDVKALAESLGVLGSPTRLSLLLALRQPRTLMEIELRVAPSGEGDATPRPLARQTIREHLTRLMELGVVTASETERDFGPTVEYSLNHQALYSLMEDFRSLAQVRPVAELRAPTVARTEPVQPFDIAGPCLVLVKGLDDGRLFDLAPPRQGRKEWVVGRSRTADVPLDYDRLVSTENSLVIWEDGSYFVSDLEASRNGTDLNFQLLPKATRHALRTGDLIGVGRSLLMFRR